MGIGALNASLAYTRPCCAFDRDAAPPAPGSDTRVELNFTYSSPLVEGDVLEARLGGFEALNSTVKIEEHYYEDDEDSCEFELGFNETAGWANSTLTLLVTRGCAASQPGGMAIRGLTMPTSSLRFDEPFITLACPRCKTARARPAPIKTPGYGVAFAQAFVTALDGGRAKAGDTARVVLTAAFSEDGLSGGLHRVLRFGWAGFRWRTGGGRGSIDRNVALVRFSKDRPNDPERPRRQEGAHRGRHRDRPQSACPGLALRANLEDSVWSPGGVSEWLADPVKVHAALNQKIGAIQDDYGYDIGNVALDNVEHNPTADTTPVGALLNGTLDFGGRKGRRAGGRRRPPPVRRAARRARRHYNRLWFSVLDGRLDDGGARCGR